MPPLQDASAYLPPRRRVSLLSRPRPKTSCSVGLTYDPSSSDLISEDAPTNLMFNHGASKFDTEGGNNSLAGPKWNNVGNGSESDPLASLTINNSATVHRSASKSFSSFRSGAHEITSLVRKMSQSLRPKNNRFKQDLSNASNSALLVSEKRTSNEGSAGRSTYSSLFRSQKTPHRRPSLPLLNSRAEVFEPRPSISVPVPGNGALPPILPDDMHHGAAARAAAAAQNEAQIEAQTEMQNEPTRPSLLLKPDPRLSELRLTRDSESGIGIDMRDQPETVEVEEEVIRQDPAQALPAEIMEQILAYLDPTSLMNAECVCLAWNHKARSRHVWRHTFHREYDRHNAPARPSPSSTRLPAAGLGKRNRDQDWKKMYKVRRALEQRWEDRQASAIYLNGHKDIVYCVKFDEHKIITGSRDQTIRVWDARTYQCLRIIGVPTSNGHHQAPAAWSPPLSSTGLIPMCTINTTSRDPVTRRNSLSTTHYHKASILCLQFDDEIMVTGSSDFTCIVWSIRDNYKPVRRLRAHTAGVLDVCFDNKHIITCSKDTTICVWDRNSGELIKKLTGHRGPVNAAQLKGDLVVSASGDGIAKLWNLKSGLCIKEFPSRDRGLACVEFSDDGKTILAGGNDQVIYQFDANTAELVRELKGHKGLVRSLHLDTVNNRIVSGSYDMSIKVWDADQGSDETDGGLKLDIQGWTESWMLAAKSDYRRVVATSQDGRAVIVDFGYGLEGVELLEG